MPATAAVSKPVEFAGSIRRVSILVMAAVEDSTISNTGRREAVIAEAVIALTPSAAAAREVRSKVVRADPSDRRRPKVNPMIDDNPALISMERVISRRGFDD
jgi:hypothetical protein